MVHQKIRYCLLLACLALLCCKRDSELPGLEASGYPKDVGTIILNKCATSGCHNELSYVNADGLNLSSWNKLFNGGYLTGSTVIPYRSDFSSLCYFTNVDSGLGLVLLPTMPVNAAPLSKAEYATLRSWINAGAPNASGYVKFSGNADREKFYVCNRQCNVVTVMDADSLLQMRYVNVGNGNTAQFPYCIKVSPDKKYWYVSFYTQCNIIQKFDAGTDVLVAEINIGTGSWTTFAITSDSRYGYFVDNSAAGKIVYVDLEQMLVLATYTFNGNPIGIALDEGLKKLYVGASDGNFVYNIDVTNPLSPNIYEMPIDGSTNVQYRSLLNPLELLADPGSNKCYIACQGSEEIRVWDMEHDTLCGVIGLGSSPAYMAYSSLTKQLFVSCPDDSASFPGNRGAVVAVNAQNYTVTQKINSGYQPYGIAVNDKKMLAAVVNANISSGGPASHHSSGCGKKNGNMTFIDLNTLSLNQNKKLELAVFPYAVGSR